ncbi:MAG: type II toxin-antitoxin system ParD family antitoxin [Burkholderiaceae bacterium]|nr:MAG: type II toxin-antitoxin system ParD family antitoxin [Burkholderiaceae bacterium]TBR72865.1 MAG: type II toxin-antitoxin system ParD family antitoxin [Burkholderiaceae bacterium]
MNISLTEDLKSFVDARVKARGYSTTSEYMRELVRRDEEQAKVERLRALIQEGLDSPLLPADFDVSGHLKATIASHRAKTGTTPPQ